MAHFRDGERVLATPTQGRRIRRPEDGALVPAEGRVVAVSAYWRRKAADGDVTLSRPRPSTRIAATPGSSAGGKKAKEA